MKLLIISDIHGFKTNLPKIKEKYYEHKCDKLVILGDIFYTSPRNRLLKEYDVDYVKKFILEFKNNIIIVKGNCDSENEILKFSNIKDLILIKTINEDLYLTHGHIYNSSNWTMTNSILIYGHLHVPFIRKIESNLYINPGSISFPRENSSASYLIYDENSFVIYDINDNIIDKYIL